MQRNNKHIPRSARLRQRTCRRCNRDYMGSKYSQVCPYCQIKLPNRKPEKIIYE